MTHFVVDGDSNGLLYHFPNGLRSWHLSDPSISSTSTVRPTSCIGFRPSFLKGLRSSGLYSHARTTTRTEYVCVCIGVRRSVPPTVRTHGTSGTTIIYDLPRLPWSLISLDRVDEDKTPVIRRRQRLSETQENSRRRVPPSDTCPLVRVDSLLWPRTRTLWGEGGGAQAPSTWTVVI